MRRWEGFVLRSNGGIRQRARGNRFFVACCLVPVALFWATSAHASTITSPTCSQSDVQNSINSAASGDTVLVPAGSCTWSSSVNITKAITLTGTGSANTLITGGVSYSPTLGEETKIFEMSGFTFQGTGAKFTPTAPGGTNPITGLKIHDNAFNGATIRALVFSGLEFGVIYHNTFSGNFISVSVIGASWAGETYPHTFGSANYPYFEDNTFGNGAGEFVSETGQGGRLVMRHNTITGYACSGCEVFDVHGEQNSGGWTTSSEYYHNTIGVGSSGTYRWMHLRGGQAIIANNTVSRNIPFNFTEYMSWGGNGFCSPYPVAFNSSETACSPISASCLETQINNSYFFNNTAGGSQQLPTFTNNDQPGTCGSSHESQYIQQNREYWLPTSGPASARPATCTADGNTYYGATDTDEIFKCTSANIWTLFYEPYTYPHPLRSATDNAASCSQTDVQNALNSAGNGDTVLLPAGGNCTWSGVVTIPNNINITLNGNGNRISGSIQLPSSASFQARVTNFTFTIDNSVNTYGDAITNLPWRLDHSTFDATGTDINAMMTTGEGPGLIDHSSFINLPTAKETIHNAAWGAGVFTGWSNAATPGSPAGLYIENNTVLGAQYSNLIQSYYGARTIIRNNTFIGPQVDYHGDHTPYSARWWEIYNNSWASGSLMCLRGGSGLIFGNSGTANAFFVNETADNSCGIGEGQNQTLFPAYLWNNPGTTYNYNVDGCSVHLGTVNVGVNVMTSNSGTTLPSTCNTNDPFWKTNEGSWNQSGSGGQGVLYKCTAPNTWTLYYTPFTYPYPINANGFPNPSVTTASGSACDLNGDGSTNVSDVQLCVNQAIGAQSCTTGDINKDGVCNVIDVQRDVNAALGGQCVTQ